MIQIGAPLAADFSDPLGVLRDCHRRIERFLQLLISVTAQAKGGAPNAEQRAALETALRYFREAAPKHTADEEESLFPRLRAAPHPHARAALAAVRVLERDHHEATLAHAAVEAIGRRWLTGGQLSEAATGELAERLGDLQAMYRRHIGVEDDGVFQLARDVLRSSDLQAMGREMARRRGLDPGAATQTTLL